MAFTPDLSSPNHKIYFRHRTEATIARLKESIPRRTPYDFLKLLGYLAFIAVGMAYSYFSYLFLRDKMAGPLGTANEMVKGIIQSREKDYKENPVTYYETSQSWDHRINAYRQSIVTKAYPCDQIEGASIKHGTSLKNDECIIKQKTYTSFTNILPYLQTAETLLNAKEFLVFALSPGFLCILMSLMMITADQRRRLALPNSTLSDAEKQELKSLGQELKLQITNNARIDILIAALETRLNLIAPDASMLVTQSIFNRTMNRLLGRTQPSPSVVALKELRI